MIYVDSSVVLAEILSEDHFPSNAFWDDTIVPSRLLEDEIVNRLHGRRLSASHFAHMNVRLRQVELLELAPLVLARALQPFPVAVRTLDGLHLASAVFVAAGRPELKLASYDKRMLDAARSLGLDPYQP